MSQFLETLRPASPRRHGPSFIRRPLVVAALIVLIAILFITAFAELLAPFDLNEGSLANRLQAPSAAHWWGTDDLGRDVLSRTLYATQTSMLIAVGAAVIGGLFGALLGAIAGWAGGAVDSVISFFIDVQASVPAFILALGVVVFFGGSPAALVIVLALEGWERFARMTRGQVMLARRSGYSLAAINLGVPSPVVIRRHILPAVAGPLLVQFTQALPAKILLESALSFLGLGIRPPATSLGQMVGVGRDYLTTAWWIALMPLIGIVLVSVAISLIGDQLQDRMVDRD